MRKAYIATMSCKMTKYGGLVWSTSQVARLLGVSPVTVIRWIDVDKTLPAERIGKGHRRIYRDHLIQFIDRQNIRMPKPLIVGATNVSY